MVRLPASRNHAHATERRTRRSAIYSSSVAGKGWFGAPIVPNRDFSGVLRVSQVKSGAQKFVHRPNKCAPGVPVGFCLASASPALPLPPCTRARCSRRARHARSSRRARARASPRMRATNDVGVPMSPLSLPARLLSALRSTAPCTRARVYRARSSRTHARLTCARAAWRWRARRFGLTSLDVSHVDVAFADTQNDEDDERDDDERDDD